MAMNAAEAPKDERRELQRELQVAVEEIVDLCDQADALIRRIRCAQHKHEWAFISYNLVVKGGSKDLDHLDMEISELKNLVQQAQEYKFSMGRAHTYLTYTLNHVDKFEVPEIPQ